MTKKRNMDNGTAKAFLVQALNQYLYNTNEQCKEAFAIAIKALEREETCHNDTNGKGDFYCDKCHCWIEQRETEVLDTGVRHSFYYCPNCRRKVEK